jgi:hypothetical protein
VDPEEPAHEVFKRKVIVNPREPWWEEQVEAFRDRWPVGSKQRLAFEILYWSGARLSDAVEFGWQKLRDGWLPYVQKKTGGPCTVPSPLSCPAICPTSSRIDKRCLRASRRRRTT